MHNAAARSLDSDSASNKESEFGAGANDLGTGAAVSVLAEVKSSNPFVPSFCTSVVRQSFVIPSVSVNSTSNISAFASVNSIVNANSMGSSNAPLHSSVSAPSYNSIASQTPHSTSSSNSIASQSLHSTSSHNSIASQTSHSTSSHNSQPPKHLSVQQCRLMLLYAPWQERPIATAPANANQFAYICNIPMQQILSEQAFFLQNLHRFLALWPANAGLLGKVPELGERPLDLLRLFALVVSAGGFRQVSNERKWMQVVGQLLGNAASVAVVENENLVLVVRWIYARMLYVFEQAVHWKVPSVQLVECLAPNIWAIGRQNEQREGNNRNSSNPVGQTVSRNAPPSNQPVTSNAPIANQPLGSLFNHSAPQTASSPFSPAFTANSPSPFASLTRTNPNFVPLSTASNQLNAPGNSAPKVQIRQPPQFIQKPPQQILVPQQKRQNPFASELELIRGEFLSSRSLQHSFLMQIPFRPNPAKSYIDFGKVNAKKLKLSLFSGCARDVVYALNALATLSLSNAPSIRGIEWIFDALCDWSSIPTEHTLALLYVLRNVCAVDSPEEMRIICANEQVVEALFAILEAFPQDHPISICCLHLICTLSLYLDNVPASVVRIVIDKLETFVICHSPMLFFCPKDHLFTSYSYEWLRGNCVRDYKMLTGILAQFSPAHALLTCICNVSHCISQHEAQEISLHLWHNFLVPILIGPLYKFSLSLRVLLESISLASSSAGQGTELLNIWLKGTLLADAFGFSDWGNIENALDFVTCCSAIRSTEALEGLVKVFLELVRCYNVFDSGFIAFSASAYHSKPFSLAMKLGGLLEAFGWPSIDWQLEEQMVNLLTVTKNAQLAAILSNLLSCVSSVED